MRWPRGKYNGQRIAGFEVKVRLDVFCWSFCLPTHYRCLGLGPIKIWFSASYAMDPMARAVADKLGKILDNLKIADDSAVGD